MIKLFPRISDNPYGLFSSNDSGILIILCDLSKETLSQPTVYIDNYIIQAIPSFKGRKQH